jgi:hypothetical protein
MPFLSAHGTIGIRLHARGFDQALRYSGDTIGGLIKGDQAVPGQHVRPRTRPRDTAGRPFGGTSLY